MSPDAVHAHAWHAWYAWQARSLVRRSSPINSPINIPINIPMNKHKLSSLEKIAPYKPPILFCALQHFRVKMEIKKGVRESPEAHPVVHWSACPSAASTFL